MQELLSFIRTRQPVNLFLVAINILVFIVLSIIGDTQDAWFMAAHGACYTPFVLEYGEYYRLFTCMFLHFGIEHLFYNMLLLIFVGDTLEKTAGKVRYLLIYLIGGLAGNILSVWAGMDRAEYAVSAGASGAIFAVIGALIWIVLRNKGKLEGYSSQRLILMAGLSVVNGLTETGIDNWAHIGGLAGGFLLAVLLYRKKAGAMQKES
ncbi:MAG: rhomboid family intramembrane serine protease [Lachnospiraceae bacterium]|nr:rhomboid family intramembrane serine protease [Lachnospiraceae bacterium]